MSPIKVGFVGLSSSGWASSVLAPSLLKSDAFTLTAISTTSSESAKASAEKYSGIVGHPVKPYYGSTSKIANDPDVDLVAVAVKTPSHRDAVLPVIDAGKDLFIEWPAGNGLKETQEFAAAARAKGIRTVVGLQGRHTAVVKKVKEILQSGKIGKVLSTSVIALTPRGYWGPQTSERNAYTVDPANGATMLSIGIGHYLEIFTQILGDFASVSATAATLFPNATLVDSDGKPTGQVLPNTAPDHWAFSGQLQSGAFANLVWRGGLKATQGRQHLIWEIDGEEGSIRLSSDSSAFLHITDPQLYVNGELVEVESNQPPVVGNLQAGWEEFAKGSSGTHATLDDAVRLHRLLDAISVSAKEGKRIDL